MNESFNDAVPCEPADALNQYASWSASNVPERDHPYMRALRLTPRQLDVLALICEGLPTKIISRRLNISSATVKVHISAILRELGVSNRVQALLSAQQYGLLHFRA